MYANIIKGINPAMTTVEAEGVVSWMRDVISPTLDHLPKEAFKGALVEFYATGMSAYYH